MGGIAATHLSLSNSSSCQSSPRSGNHLECASKYGNRISPKAFAFKETFRPESPSRSAPNVSGLGSHGVLDQADNSRQHNTANAAARQLTNHAIEYGIQPTAGQHGKKLT